MERLAALSQPSPQSFSRQEHDTITESKLVRKRTQAKQRSEREGGAARPSMEDARQVVDVIRNTSIARHHPHGSGGGAAPSLGSVVEQTSTPPHGMNAQVPPPGSQAPTPGPPQGQGPRQFPNQHRYTLVDPGSGSYAGNGSPPPGRADAPSYARPAGRPPGQRAGSTPMPSPGPLQDQFEDGESLQAQPPARQAARGPTTFAEMGIQGAKLEQKECVIM